MTKTSFYTTIEIKIRIMIFVCLGFIMPLKKYSHYELDMKGDLLLAHVLNYRCYGGAIQESSMGGKPTKGYNQKKLCVHIHNKKLVSPCR